MVSCKSEIIIGEPLFFGLLLRHLKYPLSKNHLSIFTINPTIFHVSRCLFMPGSKDQQPPHGIPILLENCLSGFLIYFCMHVVHPFLCDDRCMILCYFSVIDVANLSLTLKEEPLEDFCYFYLQKMNVLNLVVFCWAMSYLFSQLFR